MDARPTEASGAVTAQDGASADPSSASIAGAPAATAPDGSSDPAEASERSGRPASVNAIFGILAIAGAAILGYAIALAASSAVGRDLSLIWALLGAALIVTAWGLRGRHWWAAAATVAAALVGLLAGMLGVSGLLILANTPNDARASWTATVGLTAVGAASIAILGLIPSAWAWLDGSAKRRATSSASGLEVPPAA